MKEFWVRLHLEELPEGVFLATSDNLPGLVAQGRSIAETLEIAQDVARKLVESYIDEREELPPGLQEISRPRAEIVIPVGISA